MPIEPAVLMPRSAMASLDGRLIDAAADGVSEDEMAWHMTSW